jgi:hypothetical protein
MRFPDYPGVRYAHLLPRDNDEEFTDDLWKLLLVFKLSFAEGRLLCLEATGDKAFLFENN